ncbi:hypothetical protein JJL45_11895 [Tamlana sp. s12]|uniref:hypothetical protein n=1 Tax=Tamlana sp. s12 TaxID=1630406 RepID=UPI0007FDB250|nr:hypothetical protein [Tamlana sp. s12]OBQ46706.1 hypothetical protein VQ01_15495 [Tamlana sp. s12]QQY81624.1 hypothetical protein JJL45_11895 [Tamlana sp. s12]
MEELKRKIKELVIGFENGKETAEKTVENINELSSLKIDVDFLRNHWRSSDLESFIELISTPQIENWTEIDDDYANKLIAEILDNLSNDALINRNSTALERRYKKTTGTISDWIFYKDISDRIKILELLKTNTTIQL